MQINKLFGTRGTSLLFTLLYINLKWSTFKQEITKKETVQNPEIQEIKISKT